jgi:molybdate transport system regulatory protein
MLTPDLILGPGKADLLEGIAATGSIAAAGRAMGMSYKKSWALVDVMNRGFGRPVVAAVKGGKDGGGTALTPLGRAVLARYRALEAAAPSLLAEHLEGLSSLLDDGPEDPEPGPPPSRADAEP